MKILVLYYSTYGHMRAMAKAAVEGATKIDGAEVVLRRVAETLPDEVLEKMGALDAKKAMQEDQEATNDDLKDVDGIIFAMPTRFGNMPAQMKTFFDATGGLWMKGALVGKVGGVMTSAANQHGGVESTILATHTVLLHHGMVIAGLPYAFKGQMGIDEIKGGSPYGASTIVGNDGARMPSDVELDGARFQGEYLAKIAKKLAS